MNPFLRHGGPLGLLLLSLGCAKPPAVPNPQPTCSALSGSPWVPTIPGVSESNHSGTVSLLKTVSVATGKVVGMGQGFTEADLATFTVDMGQDLGSYGSLMLIGLVKNFPTALKGGAFAYLVELNDGVNRYIYPTSGLNSATAASGSCAASGFYTCTGGVCSINSSCRMDVGAYPTRIEWELRQGGTSTSGINTPSVNLFPNCNWSGGTVGSSTDPACPFVTAVAPASSSFFPVGTDRLRFGGTYTAKFLIMADSYAKVSSGQAQVELTTVRKVSNSAPGTGAMDLNVILVGNSNIQASRSEKGKQNLNTLVSMIANSYDQSGTGIKIGRVNAVEFPCSAGGDQFATLPINQLGDLLVKSNQLLSDSSEEKAMNLFLVSSIENDDSNSNLTILGVDGSLGAPLKNGTTGSGMVVSTFDALDQLNPKCTSATPICPSHLVDSSFFQFVDTCSHELGHALNLAHLTEGDVSSHDSLPDTPVCTLKTGSYISISSCQKNTVDIFPGTGTSCATDCAAYDPKAGVFCEDKLSCQFNYVMWWTTKNFNQKTGNGDGSLFSADEGKVMNYHPVVQ